MPIAIMLLFLVFAVGAELSTGTGTGDQDRNQQMAAAVATQMTWYHMQAVRQCSSPAVCKAGTLTVTAPGKGATMSYSTSFVSVTDGKRVITTWNTGNRLAAAPLQLAGLIGSELRKQSYSSAGAGTWSLSSQSVQGNSTYTYTDGTSGQSSVSVPTTFASMTFTDGVPMLVSNTY